MVRIHSYWYCSMTCHLNTKRSVYHHCLHDQWSFEVACQHLAVAAKILYPAGNVFSSENGKFLFENDFHSHFLQKLTM